MRIKEVGGGRKPRFGGRGRGGVVRTKPGFPQPEWAARAARPGKSPRACPCDESHICVTVLVYHHDPRCAAHRSTPTRSEPNSLSPNRTKEIWEPARRKRPQTSKSPVMWRYRLKLPQRLKSSCNFHTVKLFTSPDTISRSHTSRSLI